MVFCWQCQQTQVESPLIIPQDLTLCSHFAVTNSSPPPGNKSVWSSLSVSFMNHPGGDLNLILREVITLDFFGSIYPH